MTLANLNKSYNSERSIIFLHIPKTAGSTLNIIINREYERNSTLSLYKGNFDEYRNELQELSEAQKRKIKLLRGHIKFGLHTYLPQPCAYITLLREPVSRIISSYYFILNQPQHKFYNQLQEQNLSLKDYVVSELSVGVNNGQTAYIAGLESKQFNLQSNNATLELAKKNIQEHFAFIGLTEKFDESLLILKHTLNWKRPYYLKQKVNKKSVFKEDIPLDILDTIEKYNQLDIELYKYVKEKFERQLKQANWKDELKQFQFLNGIYSKVSSLTYRLKNAFKLSS